MLKLLKTINPLITGIFFLIWAIDGYFLFGNIGKYVSLIVGFLLIVFSATRQKPTKQSLNFFLVTLPFYLLFLLIAFLQNQDTLNSQQLIFGFICFILLNAGFMLAINKNQTCNIGNKLVLFYCFLTLLGAYAFFKQQSAISYLATSFRDLGDESLNPIGLAYNHSLLFLFLFWLFYQNRNKILRAFIILAMISMGMVILYTLSRGAIIYLVVFLLIFYFKGMKLSGRILFHGIKVVLLISLAIIIFLVFVKDSPFVQGKIDTLINRFSSLFEFFQNKEIDLSAQERKNVYSIFLNDWVNYFFGQEDYKPYPHNQFLETFMRWGVFGIPLIIFSIRMFFKSFKQFTKKNLLSQPTLFLVIALFIFSYLQSMSSMSFEMNRMLWFGFGFLFNYQSRNILNQIS